MHVLPSWGHHFLVSPGNTSPELWVRYLQRYFLKLFMFCPLACIFFICSGLSSQGQNNKSIQTEWTLDVTKACLHFTAPGCLWSSFWESSVYPHVHWNTKLYFSESHTLEAVFWKSAHIKLSLCGLCSVCPTLERCGSCVHCFSIMFPIVGAVSGPVTSALLHSDIKKH